MEHFRRENLLFESYIIRNTKDLGKDVKVIYYRKKLKKRKAIEKKKKKLKKRKCYQMKKNMKLLILKVKFLKKILMKEELNLTLF